MKAIIKTLVIAMGMSVVVSNAMAANVDLSEHGLGKLEKMATSSVESGAEETTVGGGQLVYDLLVSEGDKEVANLRVSPMMGEPAEQNDFEAIPYVKSSKFDESTKKTISETGVINTGVTFRVTPSFCGDDSICTKFHISNLVLKKMHSVSDEHGNKIDLPDSTDTIFEGAYTDGLESLRKKDSVVWTSTSNGLTYTVSLHLM